MHQHVGSIGSFSSWRKTHLIACIAQLRTLPHHAVQTFSFACSKECQGGLSSKASPGQRHCHRRTVAVTAALLA
eukprot:4178524-Amphidinium_carterae.1